MSDDLRKLIEAVEAGDVDLWRFSESLGFPLYHRAFEAYHGSLDSAIALCEALLPGWAISNMSVWPGKPRVVALFGTHEFRGERYHNFRDGRVYAEGPTLAQALLLAVLRAKLMEAEGERAG